MSSPELPSDLAEDLLTWYDRQKRDLPWRRNTDAYSVWISEIMLQQTQVQTARPYFEAFMKTFPNLRALAEAPLDEVLARWSGLGYYRRARMLHAAARQLVAEGRNLPSTHQELLKLPGIGPYTAAAIASIAFDQRIPVLDGNVERVMSRLLAFGDDPKKSASKRHLTESALVLVSPLRPGDSNQALMELGATVCRPKSPKCLLCPLRSACRGRSSPEEFPRSKTRQKPHKVDISVAVVHRDDQRVLVFRRPEHSSLLAGMWELPHVVLDTRSDQAQKTWDPKTNEGRSSIAAALASTYGGRWHPKPASQKVRHSITHRAITLHIHPCNLESEASEVRQRPIEAAWISADDRDRFAVSSAVTKVLKKHLGWS